MKSNAQHIKAKLIVEAANGPITFEADEIAENAKILLLFQILWQMREELPLVTLNGSETEAYQIWQAGKKKNAYQFDTLISAIETMTGKEMPEKFKEQFIEGVNEIDLVRSGLDDMMREAYQKVRQSMIEINIPDLELQRIK